MTIYTRTFTVQVQVEVLFDDAIDGHDDNKLQVRLAKKLAAETIERDLDYEIDYGDAPVIVWNL